VLNEFAQLKLNFAHAGNQSQSGGRAWLETILDLQAHHPNIYFDISCNGVRPSYYAELCARLREACVKKRLQVADVSARILFGTDFMVNLFDIDSYPDYLRLFSATQGFQPYFNKNDFCTVNAERFLFGQ
jgi:predicted TIM-barrel fold metal-dependent hydrolase